MELLKKFFIISLILIKINCEILTVKKNNVMCFAVKNFIQFSEASSFPILDIVTHSEESETLDCVKSILQRSNFTFTFSSFPLKTKESDEKRKRNNILMIIDSFESLDCVLKNMTADKYDFHGYYLIILTTNSTTHLNEMFESLWCSFIYNVNILIQINNSVKMFTFFPFNDEKCHDTKSVEVNEYSTGKWEKSSFFIPKLRNFHKCQLKAGVYNYGPSALPTVDAKGNKSLNGSDVEILRALAELLNVDLDIEIRDTGYVFENGSSFGLFKEVIEGKIDICACFFYLNQLRGRFMDFTRAYFSIDLLLMIPRGVPLSPYEKLIKPLDYTVWFSFIGFLALAVIAVIIIKCRSRKIQYLFFDRNMNAVSMEMLVVLFGGSQHMMPRQSFSRVLMMTFSIYCFVIRTAYTGSLFQFLQVSLRGFVYACTD